MMIHVLSLSTVLVLVDQQVQATGKVSESIFPICVAQLYSFEAKANLSFRMSGMILRQTWNDFTDLYRERFLGSRNTEGETWTLDRHGYHTHVFGLCLFFLTFGKQEYIIVKRQAF